MIRETIFVILLAILTIFALVGFNVMVFNSAQVTPELWHTAEEFCSGNGGIEYLEGTIKIYCNNRASVTFRDLQ